MKILNAFRNQKGVSTILIVMGISAVLATFILTLQMYVSSRARMIARVRLAYKYTFVMEDAARIAVASRIEFFQGCTGTRAGNPIANATGNPATVQICMEETGAMTNRCLNDEACMCELGEADATCASHTSLDPKFWKKPNDMFNNSREELIVFSSKNSDPELRPAFQQSIFEPLIPNFDYKFLAFVERVLDRKPRPEMAPWNQANAAANTSYTYVIPNPNVYGGTPTADQTPTTSPYPQPSNDAFTFRNCANGRCVELRVCVSEANEPSIKAGLGQICFTQKISRSFVWDHSTAPCTVAAGCNCPAPSAGTLNSNDLPEAGEKGDQTCTCCPWRDRF